MDMVKIVDRFLYSITVLVFEQHIALMITLIKLDYLHHRTRHLIRSLAAVYTRHPPFHCSPHQALCDALLRLPEIARNKFMRFTTVNNQSVKILTEDAQLRDLL